ncbi:MULTISPECIES: hypothetical protein [unclassified Pantoea]
MALHRVLLSGYAPHTGASLFDAPAFSPADSLSTPPCGDAAPGYHSGDMPARQKIRLIAIAGAFSGVHENAWRRHCHRLRSH